MICPNCQAQNPEGAGFCAQCGNTVDEKELKKKLNKTRTWAIFLFGLIIMIPSIIFDNFVQFAILPAPEMIVAAFAFFFLGIQAILSFIAGFLLLKLKKETQLIDAVMVVIEGIILANITKILGNLIYLIIAIPICIPFGFMGGYLGRRMKKEVMI